MQPIRVSCVSGLIVHRDAISNICRQQGEAIENHLRSQHRRVELRWFVHGSNVDDLRTIPIRHANDLIRNEFFQTSDLILFHFGITYPAFDAIHFAPRQAKVVVDYYGVTPPHLTPADGQETLQRSYRQAANILLADQVIVHSQTTADEALAMGVSPDRLAMLPLPASFDIPEIIPDRKPTSVTRLAYLGRFVEAKGMLELTTAIESLHQAGEAFTIDLMGAKLFSSASLIASMQARFLERGCADRVRWHFDAAGTKIRQILSHTDIFVMPSHHEGFCIPVIESISCGAAVVASRAGALPETCGGLARSYPTGDASEFTNAIRQAIACHSSDHVQTDSGILPRGIWREQVAHYLKRFRVDVFEERLNTILGDYPKVRSTGAIQAIWTATRRQILDQASDESNIPAPMTIQARIDQVLKSRLAS